MTITTLCYIENDDKYLMLHRVKKQNDINKGKWIGVGGHTEDQESPEECLLREVKEETGLTLMCVFTADGYTGELIECNEGELCWVDKKIVPELPTWEGDKVFLNLLLSEEKRFFSVKLQYEGEMLVNTEIRLY